ncbi:ribokinase [Nocardioides hwasunensis]|uniref:ribokinase n=1 Tax=Nocardioides hwasunensis TaxID=397258 RepID=UPI0029649ED8|nr:ribokinase [Nocardioides hwasunensis]
MSGQVIVVGSSNYDRTTYVDSLPRPGETVTAQETRESIGGKGANQSVAAATVGVQVVFLSALGHDTEGTVLRHELGERGVELVDLLPGTSQRTGTAAITVDEQGENVIVVSPGANGAHLPEVTERCLAKVGERVGGDAVVVSQAEVPVDTIAQASAWAGRHDLRFVLNIAPYTDLPAEVVASANPLVVNETEALALLSSLGRAVPGGAEDADPVELCRSLAGCAVSVVVTLGARGAACLVGNRVEVSEPPAVSRVVDTTGAGDAFVGALAALLAGGRSLPEGVRLATELAALTVTEAGAATSYRVWTADVLDHVLGANTPR